MDLITKQILKTKVIQTGPLYSWLVRIIFLNLDNCQTLQLPFPQPLLVMLVYSSLTIVKLSNYQFDNLPLSVENRTYRATLSTQETITLYNGNRRVKILLKWKIFPSFNRTKPNQIFHTWVCSTSNKYRSYQVFWMAYL
jgi:hypothetical protein